MELISNKEKFFSKKIEIKTFVLINEINDLDLIDKLILDVREGIKTSKISRQTNVKGENTEFNYLIGNSYFHEFLKIIQPSIYKIYQGDFNIKEAWGNIYKKNDYAVTHTHEDSAFCGIIYCTDGPGPGTYFNQYDINISEKKGRFVLFHPKLEHEVKPYVYKKERITIAFNMSQVKPWENLSNIMWVNKNEI